MNACVRTSVNWEVSWEPSLPVDNVQNLTGNKKAEVSRRSVLLRECG